MTLVSFTPQQTNPDFEGLVYETRTVTTYPDTATVTATELLGGLLIDSKAGAETLTLPTAALLNAAVPGAQAGKSFIFYVRNTGNNTTTVAAGTGGTNVSGNTLTIATLSTRIFLVRITAVSNSVDPASTDTYDLYSLGVSLH
jgi:hypothetical protein